MYCDTDSKKTVVRHMIDAVAKGGYLVTGPTEGIYTMLEPLKRVKPWLYQRIA
jgi:chemotaxis protein methyltransferase CheR